MLLIVLADAPVIGWKLVNQGFVDTVHERVKCANWLGRDLTEENFLIVSNGFLNGLARLEGSKEVDTLIGQPNFFTYDKWKLINALNFKSDKLIQLKSNLNCQRVPNTYRRSRGTQVGFRLKQPHQPHWFSEEAGSRRRAVEALSHSTMPWWYRWTEGSRLYAPIKWKQRGQQEFIWKLSVTKFLSQEVQKIWRLLALTQAL